MRNLNLKKKKKSIRMQLMSLYDNSFKDEEYSVKAEILLNPN